MKRWGAILMVAVVLVWAVVATAHDFKANDTIGYFSHQPQRLFYVLGIALFGGLAFYVFDRFSPGTKRKLALVGLGAIATLLTVVTAQCAYAFIIYFSLLFPSFALVVLVLPTLVLCLASLAVLFWLEFRWFLKTGRTRWLHKFL